MDKPKNVLSLNKIKDILIIGLCFLLYFILSDGNLCYFKSTIGVPCPGCGLTRAWLSLLNGNLKEAFYFHPLFFIPLIIVVAAFLNFQPFIEFKMVKKIYSNKMFWICILVPFMIVYIIRMILFFPDTEPMTYNQNCILFKLLHAHIY